MAASMWPVMSKRPGEGCEPLSTLPPLPGGRHGRGGGPARPDLDARQGPGDVELSVVLAARMTMVGDGADPRHRGERPEPGCCRRPVLGVHRARRTSATAVAQGTSHRSLAVVARPGGSGRNIPGGAPQEPWASSSPDHRAHDGDDQRGQDGQGVADGGRLEGGLRLFHLTGITAGRQVAKPPMVRNSVATAARTPTSQLRRLSMTLFSVGRWWPPSRLAERPGRERRRRAATIGSRRNTQREMGLRRDVAASLDCGNVVDRLVGLSMWESSRRAGGCGAGHSHLLVGRVERRCSGRRSRGRPRRGRSAPRERGVLAVSLGQSRTTR